LELAQQSDEAVRLAVFRAAYDLDPGAGTSRVVLSSAGHDGATFTPQDVAEELTRAAPPDLDDATLLRALEAVVATARYWQQPDGEDLLAMTPPVSAALDTSARFVAHASATQWWATGLDPTAQCRVTWGEEEHSVLAMDLDCESALARWRQDALAAEARADREHRTDPGAAWSGVWWSTPPSVIPRTSRRLGPLPVGLLLVEDSLGWDSARVTPVAVPSGARTLEIDGPDVWAELCRRHPLTVTASRRHDWYRTTGRGDTEWLQPDWASVATEFDAVHLTVAGYLATAGRAVPISPTVHSVIAGWDPDATYWLTGGLAATGPTRQWVYDRHGDAWVERG